MDAVIETLSLNNNPPPDDIEEDVRKLLLEDSSYLDDLDSDIARLVSMIANSRNRLEHLRATRTATQIKINQYQSILSPLRRLSPELLGEIFYRCLPTHHNPIIIRTECPLLLTHICSFWRAAAISEPRLWSRLHTTFSNEYMPDSLDGASSVPSENVVRNLRRKLNAIKGWISRSGTRPLSISISFTTLGRYFFQEVPKPRPHIAMEFFAYIAQLSPRLEDLELKMPLSAYRVLEFKIDVPAMAKLTSLRAELQNDAYSRYMVPPTLLKAPNLRSVSMSTYDSSSWGIGDPSHYTSVWREMTDISCHQCDLEPIKLILLLEHAPNLVHFKATISTSTRVGSPSSVSLSQEAGYTGISLPFLRTFSLKDKVGPDTQQNLGLYNRINASRLTWVQYSGTLRPGEVVANQGENSIVGFLQRLPKLKKLTLDSEDPWYETRRIFRAVPSITHLFIGHEERTLSGSPTRNQIRNSTRKDASRVFKIDELVDSPNDHPNNGLPLLPNLVSFEMSSRSSTMEADDLVRFVTSRMNSPLPSPSSTHGSSPRIAQLKHVGVVFYRPRGRDIAKEIQKHAQNVGADMIDLFFDYPDSPMESFISSERSWKHQDAEEFTVT